MANDLTGDYDVVVEFTIDAVNRVLAAMHSGNRLPHSWSLLVDSEGKQVVVSGTDVFGDAVTDPQALAEAPTAIKPPSDWALSPSDPLANVPISWMKPGGGVIGDLSRLKGVAQLQFGAPAMTLPDDSSANVTIHTPVMARYVGDPQTMTIPEFLQGEFQMTVGVQEAAPPSGTVINVFLAGNINFNAFWSSQPLKPHQSTAINLALLNSFKTSFQPSNTVLPGNIVNMQFKTFPGDSALAMLMNTRDGRLAGELLVALGKAIVGADLPAGPSPDSVSRVFLGDGDDFALAVSRDLFQPKIDTLKALIESLSLPATGGYTVHIDPPVTVDVQDAAAGYPDGRILVTIKGGADTDVDELPNIGFTVTQAFHLIPVRTDRDGSTADLAPDGEPDVSAISTTDIPDPANVVGVFKVLAKAAVKNALRDILNQINASLEPQLGTNENLGTFLTLLMNQPPKPGAQPEKKVYPQLAYTRCEITSSGLILHGTLQAAVAYTPAEINVLGVSVEVQVPTWPPVHAEFAQVTDRATVPWIATPPTNSALNSWIPGGTIQEFIWSLSGDPQPHVDKNTFVFTPLTPIGMRRLCLTVSGTRVSATDANAQESVSATTCGWTISIDLPGGVLGGDGQTGNVGNAGLPNIALTQFAQSGALEILGHASPWARRGAANLIVHFPDGKSLAHLDFLPRALHESGRTHTAAAILVVLAPDQIAKVRPVEGVMFADDDRAWADLLGVGGRPATVVIGPSGKVLWHHQGELTSGDLAAALKKYLAAGGVFRPRLLQASVRIGQPTPNFIFEYAPRRELTLRKLVGRAGALVFWKSTSKASLETLRDLQKTFARAGSQGPVVLAINDGEALELAKKVAAENGLSAIMVPDPERDISLAYGVSIWPTTVFIDARGLVRDIRYGRFSLEQVKYPSHAAR